jgi:hypothetical protein
MSERILFALLGEAIPLTVNPPLIRTDPLPLGGMAFDDDACGGASAVHS